MKLHYIYKITNLNPTDSRKYYIGVRSTNHKSPEADSKYMSSSTCLKKEIRQYGKDNFFKEILSIWETRDLANLEEIRLHTLYNVSSNPEYYNISNATTSGFCTFGQITVIDSRDGKTKNVSKEDFDRYDYYTSTTKGKVTALDTRDGTKKHVSKEDFEKYDYYIGLTKGSIVVTDTRDGIIKNVSKADFDKYDYYVSITKGLVTAIDINTGEKKVVTTDEFKNDENLRGTNKNKVTAFDTVEKINKFIDVELLDDKRYVSIIKNKIFVKNLLTQKNEIISKSEFIKHGDLYEACSSNRTTVIDKTSGKKLSVSIEEYKNNNDYESLMINKATVIDTRDGKIKHVDKEDFKKHEYYVSINSKKIEIYKDTGVLFATCYGNFRKFCLKHNLSITAFTKSYKNNSEPVFMNLNNFALSKLKIKSRDFQIGWYAIEVK